MFICISWLNREEGYAGAGVLYTCECGVTVYSVDTVIKTDQSYKYDMSATSPRFSVLCDRPIPLKKIWSRMYINQDLIKHLH